MWHRVGVSIQAGTFAGLQDIACGPVLCMLRAIPLPQATFRRQTRA
jgi:hypothetical protein